MNAKMFWFLLLGLAWALLFLGGCGEEGPITVGDRIFIEDDTGKQWDITYAVNELNMSADQFNYGLGPNAILPIVDPQFSLPGDGDYPLDDELFLVLGVTVDGEDRAYRLSHLSSHEVVDDTFGEIAFAATY